MWALARLVAGLLPPAITAALARVDAVIASLLGPAWAPEGTALCAALITLFVVVALSGWNAVFGEYLATASSACAATPHCPCGRLRASTAGGHVGRR